MKKKTKRPGQFKSTKGTGPAKEDALHQKVSNKGKKTMIFVHMTRRSLQRWFDLIKATIPIGISRNISILMGRKMT
jgi:hypothetical protein